MDVPAAPSRRWLKIVAAVALLGIAGALALAIYINTNSFQSLVRRRLVAEIERITGGRADVGSFHTVPFRLQVEVRNLTVHGREASSDVPLAHADSIEARLKLTSLLHSELGFHEVILDQPVVHIALYPGGDSNIPPRTSAASSQTSVEKIFALSIDHLYVRSGQLLWNDQLIPLDADARDMALSMDYSFLHSRYDGKLSLGSIVTKLTDWQPFAWSGVADFSLTSNSAAFSSVKWNSGHSGFTVHGRVDDFHNPRLQISYDAHLNLAETAAITRRHDLRGGSFEIKGDGGGSLARFNSEGWINLQDVAFQNNQISFSKAGLAGNYSISDQHLKLFKLQGKIFGGSFSGDAEVTHWLSPDRHLTPAERKVLDTAVISAASSSRKPIHSAPSQPHAPQTASIMVHLHDLSAEDVARAISGVPREAPDFHLAGLASGVIDARWKGTPNDAEVQFALDSHPPATPSPGSLPLTLQTSGFYYAGLNSLELSQFNLATARSHVQASGKLSSNSALQLSVSTSSLADWLPLLEAIRGPAIIPVTLNGRATFIGNVSGSPSSPLLVGNFQVNDFDINIPATASTAAIRTQWDSLSALLQLSFDSASLHNAKLEREGASAALDATATLQHGHFTGQSDLSLHASLLNTNLHALQALAGYNYPVDGAADITLQADGPADSLQGSGRIHVTDALIYGKSVRQFDSTYHFFNGELAFDDIHLLYQDAVMTGRAEFSPSDHQFNLDLAGNNFDLSRIPELQTAGLPVDGRADISIQASGTPQSPTINGDLHLRSLALDRELAGDVDLHAATQGNVIHLTGTSHLAKGSLQVAGDIDVRRSSQAAFHDLIFRLNQVDLDALWRAYLGQQLTGHSALSGVVHLTGPVLHAGEWKLTGDLDSLAIEVEKVKLQSQEPVRFQIASDSLDIQHLRLTGEGTDLTTQGSIQLIPPYALNLDAEGHADLNLLSGFDPNVAASGMASVKMALGGNFENPLPRGTVEFENTSFAYANLPSGLTALKGLIRFTHDRLHIEALTARTGGGVLTLSGDATYISRQLSFNLSATAKDVRLRYPAGVSSTADAAISWAGTRSSSSLSGDVTINKMAITPGFDFGSYLDRSRQSATITTTNSPLNNIKLDLHVRTSPELQMRTAIARLSGDADLRVRGSVARPALLGRVDILEGQATFHGTRYTLEHGDITFANPVSIEPQLNLQASTHVRNYDLNLTITGTPDRGLNLNYRSEPPLPKSDIIALLALGRTNEESQQLQEQSGQSAFTDQATDLILNQALDSTVSSRFQRLFGASNIKIDPQGLNTETNPTGRGPEVTIEQEFANNLSLTFSTNVAQSAQQIIQGEYYIKRNISVVGTRDQNGVVSFDLRVRRRKK